MIGHKLVITRSTVIGGQESDVFALPYLFVQCSEQSAQVFIKLQIGIVGMLTTSTPLMANHIGL